MNDGEIKIMLLDRGRVKVGRVYRHDSLPFYWNMVGGRIVRIWGTSRGLEQIANEGPTSSTVLDDPCDTEIPFRAVIEILNVNEEKWKSHLPKKP